MGSRGAGSLRQRDTGRWEVRVSVGVDPVSGRSISRSVTVVGDLAAARRRKEELAAQAAALRLSQQQPLRTARPKADRRVRTCRLIVVVGMPRSDSGTLRISVPH